jgi:hypothetical protein
MRLPRSDRSAGCVERQQFGAVEADAAAHLRRRRYQPQQRQRR